MTWLCGCAACYGSVGPRGMDRGWTLVQTLCSLYPCLWLAAGNVAFLAHRDTCVSWIGTLDTLQFVCHVVHALSTDQLAKVTKRLIILIVTMFSVRYEIFFYTKISFRLTRVVEVGQFCGVWSVLRFLVSSAVFGQFCGVWSVLRCLVISEVFGQFCGVWSVLRCLVSPAVFGQSCSVLAL